MAAPGSSTIAAAADTKSSASAKKVFSIPELMETILLCLTARELFGVRRTCKDFYQTIEASAKLQRAMFMRQDASPSDFTYDKDPKLNPLLEELRFKLSIGRKQYEVGFLEHSDTLVSSARPGRGLAMVRRLEIEVEIRDISEEESRLRAVEIPKQVKIPKLGKKLMGVLSQRLNQQTGGKLQNGAPPKLTEGEEKKLMRALKQHRIKEHSWRQTMVTTADSEGFRLRQFGAGWWSWTCWDFANTGITLGELIDAIGERKELEVLNLT